MEDEFMQLIIDIRDKSKINVTSVKKLKVLKESINSVIADEISYNTFRRIYGFLPKSNPSKKTLNLLSNYLGYKSYSNYLNNRERYQAWYYKMDLLKVQRTNLDLSIQRFDSFLENLYQSNNVVTIADHIGLLVENKKASILKLFFNKLDASKLKDSIKNKFAIIITCNFHKLSEVDKLQLYKELIPIDSFRNCVPFYCIDYNYLNSYYFKVLQLVKSLNKNKSEVLFVDLMEAYKLFYSNEPLKKSKIKLPSNYKTFFPVLVSRYFGYLIFFEKKLTKNLKTKIKKELNEFGTKLFLIEIIPALILKEEFIFLEELLDEYYEDIFENDTWAAEGFMSNMLIGLANVNINSKRLKAAKINLNLINLDKIELGYADYLTLFYNLTWLKISVLENKKDEINFYFDEITKTSNEIGFHKFAEIAKQYKNK